MEKLENDENQILLECVKEKMLGKELIKHPTIVETVYKISLVWLKNSYDNGKDSWKFLRNSCTV